MDTNLPSREQMDRAVEARDASFEGVFYIAVRTTGIFCRPSCKARTPLAKNREYFATPREALLAGYRACLRCRPLELPGAAPEWARALLADVHSEPQRRWREGDLRERGIAPERARRFFQQQHGCTFHGYCRALRLGGAMRQLRNGESIDVTSLDHGYESTSGFREAFVRLFGTPPGRGHRQGCLTVRWLDSPLGPLVAGVTDEAVCLLEFTDRRALEAQIAILRRRFAQSAVPGDHPLLDRLESRLGEYFAGRRREFDLPLATPGTPFEEAVWRELLAIPYGETRCYEDIAVELGRPNAQRAVGRANGFNRISIIVPCHRVVNKDGRLCGYGGGLWRKQFLLDLERGQRVTANFAANRDNAKRESNRVPQTVGA